MAKPTKRQRQLMEVPLPTLPSGLDIPVSASKPSTWNPKHTTITRNYIYMAQVEHGALIVTVYLPTGEYIYRIYHDGDKYCAQRADEDEIRKCMVDSMQCSRWDTQQKRNTPNYCGNYIGVEGAADIIKDYLSKIESYNYGYAYEERARVLTGLDLIEGYQRYLRRKEIEKRNNKIRESTNNDMLGIRELPKAVQEWVIQCPLKSSRYIFYDYKPGGKPMHGTCSHCLQPVSVKQPRHKAQGICPNCRSRVTYIAAGTFARGSGFADTSNFAYFQPLREGYVIRYFDVAKKYVPRTTVYSEVGYEETNRDFYTKEHRFRKSYRMGNFKGTGSYEWCNYYYPAAKEAYIYPGTLSRIVKDDPRYKYAQLIPIARNGGMLSPPNILRQVVEYPWIEYIAKLKLYNLCRAVINDTPKWDTIIDPQGRNLKEILGVGKEDIPALQRIDVTIEQLAIYQIVKMHHPHIDKQALETIIWWDNFELRINRKVSEAGSIIKARKYIEEQYKLRIKQGTERKCFYGSPSKEEIHKRTCRDIASDWQDYLKECTDLQYDITQSGTAYPKDLIKAHSRTSALIKVKHNKITARKIARRAKELKPYEYKCGGYIIRPIKSLSEIIREGDELNHCVGGYADDYADGETTIMVMRKEEAPKVPLVTIEIDLSDGELDQARGKCNRSPSIEESAVLNTWLTKHVKKLVLQSTAKRKTLERVGQGVG